MTLTFGQIVNWLWAQPLPGFDPPTIGEVEDSIETLVRDGVIETVWDENGNILYRLTTEGRGIAQQYARDYGW